MHPDLTPRDRRRHALEVERARVAGAALLGLLILALWAARSLG